MKHGLEERPPLCRVFNAMLPYFDNHNQAECHHGDRQDAVIQLCSTILVLQQTLIPSVLLRPIHGLLLDV